MLVVAWCEHAASWEAVVLQEGRMVGYGQGVSRVDAVERAIRDALRRGYSVPLAQAYLAWWEGVGRYGGLSHDGEWVYARLNGDIIAVSKREAARRLVQGEPVEVSHAG